MPLTFDEKRDLCASMNKLPGKQLARAVSLIHEMVPKVVMQNGDDPDGPPTLSLSLSVSLSLSLSLSVSLSLCARARARV